MARKSLNPFKLWGSYVGFVLGLTIYIIFNDQIIDLIAKIFNLVGEETMLLGFFPLILMPIFGFFIGYGIHALVRGLRRYNMVFFKKKWEL